MYNDIIKLLNLEQFNIEIKKMETSKINNFCVKKRPSLEDRLFTELYFLGSI